MSTAVTEYLNNANAWQAARSKKPTSKAPTSKAPTAKAPTSILPPTTKIKRVGLNTAKKTGGKVFTNIVTTGTLPTGAQALGMLKKSTQEAIAEEQSTNQSKFNEQSIYGVNTTRPSDAPHTSLSKTVSSDTTADLNAIADSTDVQQAFNPRVATPAKTIFTPIAPIQGGFKLDSGYATTDFVPLVARSNAAYLGWSNRFNAVQAGAII
jgi:hypothetical protein